LSIQANIDGLPLHQSTVKGFWPILVQIITLPNSPVFTVGLYYGEKKPLSSNDFLADFVRELVELLAHGLDYQNHHFNIIFQIFCCDTPARAFIKNIKGHSGIFLMFMFLFKEVKYIYYFRLLWL
jgi:hypothetical protein